MAKRAWIIGTDNIMSWFEDNSTTPYYSVWNGKVKKFCWTGADEEKGKDFLRNNLQAAEDAGITDILTLRLNTEVTGKDINDRTPYNIEVEFACAGAGIAGVSGNSMNQQFYRENFNSNAQKMLEALKVIADNQIALQNEIAAMKAQKLLEDAEDEGEAEDESVMGVVKGYLEDPMVKKFIIGQIGRVFGDNRPMGAIAGPGAQEQAISKDDAQLLHEAITRLKRLNNRLGADLSILADVGEKNRPVFDEILRQLREDLPKII